MEIKNGMAVLSHKEFDRLYTLALVGRSFLLQNPDVYNPDDGGQAARDFDNNLLVEAHRHLVVW